VVLIAGLANPKLLGVATVLEMQRKFQSQEWAFDYMYFTESDQVHRAEKSRCSLFKSSSCLFLLALIFFFLIFSLS